MRSKPILPAKWGTAALILALIYAFLVMGYILVETGKPLGSRDFHQFWYAGHFILQRQDPYEAFFAKEPPRLPIHYIDGVTITHYPVAQADLEITPSNTPAMLLMLSPFALLSWWTAKWVFLLINLALMVATGWLVLHRIPFRQDQLARSDQILLFVIYFDLSATRIAIENGQTTLFVFLLMILAVMLYDRAWHLSGISLGLALSKYSLSIPIFLFFIYKKKINILLFAVLIQLVGILGMSEITGNSPVTIIYENIMLFLRLFDQPGVHLSRWFEFISGNHFLSIIPSLVMTVLVFVPLFFWTYRKKAKTDQQEDIVDLHIITILFLWTLLVAYHRLYDTLILIFFLLLIVKGLAHPNLWGLSEKQQKALLWSMLLIPLFLILPARIVDLVLPFYYGSVSDGITTILLVMMLILSMSLLRRYLQVTPLQTIPKEVETHGLRNDPHSDTQPRWTDYSESPPSNERPQQPVDARGNGRTRKPR